MTCWSQATPGPSYANIRLVRPYHVIGLLNRRIWTIRWQNSLYFGLLLARSSCVWYHVIFSRSRDEIDQHVHDKAIISKSVTCKRHIRNSTGIFRVRLEFSTQIILPSTIFRTNFVESFALRLVRFESQKEKKPYTYQQGKGQWAFTVISGNRFSIITLMILQIPFSKPTCFELKILTAGRVPLKVQKKKKNLLNLEGGNRAEQIQSYFSN